MASSSEKVIFHCTRGDPMVRVLAGRRWLLPIYRLNNRPLAWECAMCGKMFSISPDEAARASDPLPPPHIEQEFHLHNCELQLRRRFPDPDL